MAGYQLAIVLVLAVMAGLAVFAAGLIAETRRVNKRKKHERIITAMVAAIHRSKR